MMVKGFVTNNTGRSKHIFKMTVYPGQKVSLKHVQKVLEKKVPEGDSFLDFIDDYLPDGWEVITEEAEQADFTDGRPYKEVLTAKPVVAPSVSDKKEEDSEADGPSLEYITPRAIDKLTAKDIFNLRLKDNPKRLIKQVNSIHKLRRALTLCKNDSRKSVLTRIIQHRIKELNIII